MTRAQLAAGMFYVSASVRIRWLHAKTGAEKTA